MCQWTSSGRKAALLNFARNQGRSIGDENMQIDFILYELTTSYKKVLEVLKNAKTVVEASDYVCKKYERPADQSVAALEKRAVKGEALFEELAKDYVKEDVKMLKVCIDAGHDLYTPGKRCMKKIDPNETREWSLNSRIAEKLEDLLKAYNCEVLRVDDRTGKTDISLANRCKKSNAWGADVYISIHHNAGINGRSGGGTVVFYYSSKAERKKQAQALYNALVASTGLIGNRWSKVIKKGYYVVKNTDAPAFLFENGFMDSKTDVPIILSEAHADKTAQALVAWLIDSFRLTKADASESTAGAPEANQEPAKLPYRVKITADSLNVRAGAGIGYKVNTVVRKNEVYTIVEEVGGWGKLKSGAGYISLKYTVKC